jgi:putative membrane protein
MFVNYITLMLVNLAIGMFLVAGFLLRGMDGENARDWTPGFAAVGLVLTITGLHMSLTWPVPGSYNIAFGEMAALFGVLMLAMAGVLTWGWSLMPLGIYGVLAGIAAIVAGLRIVSLGMTLQPIVAGLGFVITGAVGVLAAPLYLLRGMPQLRAVALALAILSGILWALIGYMAYWSHLDEYQHWKVPGMEQRTESKT